MKDGYYWYTKNPDEATDHVEREMVEIKKSSVLYFGTDYMDSVEYCISHGEFMPIELD